MVKQIVNDAPNTAPKAPVITPGLQYDPYTGRLIDPTGASFSPNYVQNSLAGNPGITSGAAMGIAPGTGPLAPGANQMQGPGYPGTAGATSPMPIQNPAGPSTDPLGQYTYLDPSAALAAIYAQKAPDFAGSASADMQKAYAPVLNDLTAQGTKAGANAKYNDAQLAAMYAALQNSTGHDTDAIKLNNGQAVQNIASAGANSQAAIGQAFGNAASSNANLLAKLGIQAAAPESLNHATNGQDFLQGTAANQTQSAQNLAQQLGTNAQNFSAQQQNIAGFEGNQARTHNQQDLSNKMAQLATERAQVGSQSAQQATQLASTLRGQYMDSLASRANALLQQYSAQNNYNLSSQQFAAQMAMSQQNNALEMAKIELSRTPTAPQNFRMAGTGQQLYAQADQIFNGNANLASKAVNIAMGIDPAQYASGVAYTKAVMEAARNDPELAANGNMIAQLAISMYGATGAKPSAPAYYGNGQ